MMYTAYHNSCCNCSMGTRVFSEDLFSFRLGVVLNVHVLHFHSPLLLALETSSNCTQHRFETLTTPTDYPELSTSKHTPRLKTARNEPLQTGWSAFKPRLRKGGKKWPNHCILTNATMHTAPYAWTHPSTLSASTCVSSKYTAPSDIILDEWRARRA